MGALNPWFTTRPKSSHYVKYVQKNLTDSSKARSYKGLELLEGCRNTPTMFRQIMLF